MANIKRKVVELVHPHGGRIAVEEGKEHHKELIRGGWLTPKEYSALDDAEIEKHQGHKAMGKEAPKAPAKAAKPPKE